MHFNKPARLAQLVERLVYSWRGHELDPRAGLFLGDNLMRYTVFQIICPPPLVHVGKLVVTCGDRVSTGTESRNTG